MKRKLLVLIMALLIAMLSFTGCFNIKKFNFKEDTLPFVTEEKITQEVIPVERIEITNEGQKYNEQQGDYIVVNLDANGDSRVQITYKVYPENASNKDVDFVYEEVDGVTVDENGVVSFSKRSIIRVRVVATDGTNHEDSLLIIAR